MWLIEWLMDWSNENDLWLFLPIMGALTLVGVVLAGHFEDGMLHYAGVALFIVSIIWIFLALKGYFDAKDRGKAGH